MPRLTRHLPALLPTFALLMAPALLGACGPATVGGGDEPVVGCASDEDCKGERICFDGDCLFPEELATVDGAIGAACTDHSDCAGEDGRCFEDLPGGYCVVVVESCEAGCRAGSACVEAGEDGLCLETCTGDEDCREGYACTDRLGPSVCHVREGGGDTPPGAPCAEASDCAGAPATCVTEWPEGYCAPYDCVAEECPAGSTCHPESAIEVGGACLADCAEDGDCRTGYVCRPTALGGACVPDCTGADVCEGEETCDTASGHCVGA